MPAQAMAQAEDALLRVLRILDSPGGNWKEQA